MVLVSTQFVILIYYLIIIPVIFIIIVVISNDIVSYWVIVNDLTLSRKRFCEVTLLIV